MTDMCSLGRAGKGRYPQQESAADSTALHRQQDLDGFMGLILAEEAIADGCVHRYRHFCTTCPAWTVAPEIPVYLNENAAIIERALEAKWQGVPTVEREYIHFEADVPIHVGGIQAADHDQQQKLPRFRPAGLLPTALSIGRETSRCMARTPH